MNRFLQWLNLAGIVALATLCAIQWRNNRGLNLQVIALDETRLQQVDLLAKRDEAIRGYTADLEDFRQRLTLAESQLKELDDKLGAMTRDRNRLVVQQEQLVAERDRLKVSLDQWMAAVAARDAALKQAGERISQLGVERNDAVAKFNELAGKYNTLVKDWNKMQTSRAATRPAATSEK